MFKENYLRKMKELPETIRQFFGLVALMFVIFVSFFVLNNIFGEGD